MSKAINYFYEHYEGVYKTIYRFLDIFFILVSITPLIFKFELSIVRTIEIVTVIYFIGDYLLRLIASRSKYGNGFKSYFKYFASFYAVIDLISILPIFSVISDSFKAFRAFRLLKTFRFFKALKYSTSFNTLTTVLKKEKNMLLSVLSISMLFVFISALMIYQVEGTAQPELYHDFFDAIWWSVATLTTVGYGDIYPITDLGRVISMFISFTGIAIVALPSGIIAAGFIKEKNDK